MWSPPQETSQTHLDTTPCSGLALLAGSWDQLPLCAPSSCPLLALAGSQPLSLPSPQVLQGAQLIAVASAEPASGGVDGSPLQGSDIQVQYVQLTPVTDHSATNQVRSEPFLLHLSPFPLSMCLTCLNHLSDVFCIYPQTQGARDPLSKP